MILNPLKCQTTAVSSRCNIYFIPNPNGKENLIPVYHVFMVAKF